MDDRAHAFTQCRAYGARVVHVPSEQQECRAAAAQWIRDTNARPDTPGYSVQSSWDVEGATLCMYLELPDSAAQHAGTVTVVHRAMYWDTLVLLARITPPEPAACDASIPVRLAVLMRPDLIDNVWHVLRSEVASTLWLLGNLFPQQWPPPEFEWVVTLNSTTAAGEFGPFEHSMYGLFSAPGARMHRLYDPTVTTCFFGGLAVGVHPDNPARINPTSIRHYYPMQREVALIEATLRRAYNPTQAQRYAVWEAPLRLRPVRIAVIRRQTGVRIIRNYDALLAALQSGIGCGEVEVVEIEPGRQTPEEYVPIVNSTHMLLGMHGAGMTNTALLPRGGVLLELTHKVAPESTRMYAGWAATAGVACARVTDSEWVLPELGETWYKGRDHDIIVSLEKVVATVRALVLSLLRSDSACLQQWGIDTQGDCKGTGGCMWCDDCAIAAGVGDAQTGWVQQPEVHPSQEVMLGPLCVPEIVQLNRTSECA